MSVWGRDGISRFVGKIFKNGVLEIVRGNFDVFIGNDFFFFFSDFDVVDVKGFL